MEHQPLVIIGSARKDGSTNYFVNQVFKNISHKEIHLLDYAVQPYNYEDDYTNEDKFDTLVIEMLAFKTIIFATPVYWYSMSGFMKTFFDRINSLVTTRKEVGRAFAGKTSSLIASGSDPELPDGFEIPFMLTSSYLEMNYLPRIYFTEDDRELKDSKQSEINLFLNKLP